MKWVVWCIGMVALTITFGGAIVLTSPGQALDLPRDWLVGFHQSKVLFSIVSLVLTGIFFWLNWKYSVVNRWFSGAFLALLCLGLFMQYFFTALLFPSLQNDAIYVNISEADNLLTDSETVYVVEINGDAVAYPKYFMEMPHIAGAEIGGEEVVMTYCGLSDLPMAYVPVVAGERLDFQAMIQTNNNLILRDTNSNELVQQITGVTEFGGADLQQLPNQMMSYQIFKVLYPQGRVFKYQPRWIDKKILTLINEVLEYGESNPTSEPLYPTLGLEDKRLANWENVWGVEVNGEAIAFTKEFLIANPRYKFDIGGESLLATYHAEHDVISIFSRQIGDSVLSFDETMATIDVYGNSPSGHLERYPSHNGLYWMVWSHFFPNTELKDL